MSELIVFLDEAAVSRHDLDLSPIKRLGKFKSYPSTHGHSQIVSRAKKATLIVTNKVIFGEKEFRKLPNLKLICVTATGFNNIDAVSAKKYGVGLANVAGYSTTTVAEHALMFLLACGHRLLEHHQSASNGSWSRSKSYAFLDHPFYDLKEKTLGIIGYGAIGRRVAKMAIELGMKILVSKIPGRKYPQSSKRLSLHSLLRQSDFVTIHSALTTNTHHLINKSNLKMMKKSAYLLNLARGAIVCEKDLVKSLERNEIAGYATDVLSKEPPPKNHPLLKKSLSKKVLLSPHVGWGSLESRQKVIGEVAENMKAFLKGRRRNRIV